MNRRLLLILIVALIFRLINLNQSFWMDEAAQALESARPLFQQLTIPNDFHPPLYHLFVHLFTYISTQEWWLRLTSVIAGLGTVILVYKIGKQFFTQQIGLTTALLLAIAPYHIYYSQELRMYALSAFISTLSVYALLNKNWKLYLISLTSGLYTLYLFPFIIIAHGIFILLFYRTLLKRWLLITLVSTVLFLPWLPSLFTQLQGGIELPQVWPQWRSLSSLGFYKTIPLTYAKFSLGRITFHSDLFYAGLIALSLPFFFLPLYKSLNQVVDATKSVSLKFDKLQLLDKNLLLIFHTFLIPFILAWIISLWIPLNGPWRLLLILPMYYLLIAYGLSQIRHRRLYRLTIFGILSLSLFSNLLYYTQAQFQREQWRSATEFVALRTTLSSQPVAILNAFPEPFAPIEWYASPELPVYGVLDSLKANPQTIDQQMIQILQSTPEVYYFEYLQDLTDPNRLITTWLESNQYQLIDTYDFSGVGFIHYYRLEEFPDYAYQTSNIVFPKKSEL